MPTEDAATQVAADDDLDGLDTRLTERLGAGTDRFGATVVAGPGDDLPGRAREELFSALFGGVSSGLL